MSDIGFWCTADNGKTYFNLNSGGARAISFLQRLKLAPRRKKNDSGKVLNVSVNNRDPNATLFIVPVTPAIAFTVLNSLVGSFIATESISLSGSNIRFGFTSGISDGFIPMDGGDGWFYYDVYQSINAGESAGLFLKDATGFSAITDAFKAGYCVYRTTVTIDAGKTWTVPANVTARANATVFANWSHPNAVIVYNNANKTIKVTGARVTLNIAVFSNGFKLNMPAAGVYIFSKASGDCVYNSSYIPLFVKKTAGFNGDAINTGVTRPMIPLSALGMNGSKDGDNYQLYNVGLKMSGSTVSTGRGDNTQFFYSGGYGLYFPKCSIPLLICDASQYFN